MPDKNNTAPSAPQPGFDPARHLRRLGKSDYLEVKWRLVWLRTEHPDATIRTELVELDRAQAFAMFRATVAIPGAGEASGYGSETAKDFPDFIEKAETKAIGRALGALGYGTQFTDDFDEGRRIVDSPVERPVPQQRPPQEPPAAVAGAPATPRPPTQPTGAAAGGVPATPKQREALLSLCRQKLNMSDTEIARLCRERYGVMLSQLSAKQISELTEELARAHGGPSVEERVRG